MWKLLEPQRLEISCGERAVKTNLGKMISLLTF